MQMRKRRLVIREKKPRAEFPAPAGGRKRRVAKEDQLDAQDGRRALATARTRAETPIAWSRTKRDLCIPVNVKRARKRSTYRQNGAVDRTAAEWRSVLHAHARPPRKQMDDPRRVRANLLWIYDALGRGTVRELQLAIHLQQLCTKRGRAIPALELLGLIPWRPETRVRNVRWQRRQWPDAALGRAVARQLEHTNYRALANSIGASDDAEFRRYIKWMIEEYVWEHVNRETTRDMFTTPVKRHLWAIVHATAHLRKLLPEAPSPIGPHEGPTVERAWALLVEMPAAKKLPARIDDALRALVVAAGQAVIVHQQMVDARRARALPPRAADNPARTLALRAAYLFYRHTRTVPTFVWDELASADRGDYRGPFVEWLEGIAAVVRPLGIPYAHTRQSLVAHAKRAFRDWLEANQVQSPGMFPNLAALLAAADALATW